MDQLQIHLAEMDSLPGSSNAERFKIPGHSITFQNGIGIASEVRRGRVAVGVADVEQLLISVAHTKLLIQLFTLFLAADKPHTHFHFHHPTHISHLVSCSGKLLRFARGKFPDPQERDGANGVEWDRNGGNGNAGCRLNYAY